MSLLTPAEARIVALKKQIRRHKKTLSLVKAYGVGALQRDKKKPKKKKPAVTYGQETAATPHAQRDALLRDYIQADYRMPAPRWGPAGAAGPQPNAVVERR